MHTRYPNWNILLFFVLLSGFSGFVCAESEVSAHNYNSVIAAKGCPTGIHPAENKDELVDNMFKFLLDIYGLKIVPLDDEVIQCYFSGDMRWEHSGIDSNTREWVSYEYNKKPKEWDSIRIENLIEGKNYLLRFYRKKKGTQIQDDCVVLNGKDHDFDPLLTLLKRFTYLIVDKDYHEKKYIYYGLVPESSQEEYKSNLLLPGKLKAEGEATIPGRFNFFYGFDYIKNDDNGEFFYKRYNSIFYLKYFIGNGYCYTTDNIDILLY